jgi:hypothetical protein
MKKRKVTKKPTEAELRQLRARVNKVKVEVRKASRAAENGIEKSLNQFSAAVKNAEKQLKMLRGTGREAWKELKIDVRTTWRDLKHFARKATAQLKL